MSRLSAWLLGVLALLARLVDMTVWAQRDYCMWNSLLVYLPFNQTSGSSVQSWGPVPYSTLHNCIARALIALDLLDRPIFPHPSFLLVGFSITDTTKVTWLSQGLRFDDKPTRLGSTTTIDTSAMAAANAVSRPVARFVVKAVRVSQCGLIESSVLGTSVCARFNLANSSQLRYGSRRRTPVKNFQVPPVLETANTAPEMILLEIRVARVFEIATGDSCPDEMDVRFDQGSVGVSLSYRTQCKH